MQQRVWTQECVRLEAFPLPRLSASVVDHSGGNSISSVSSFNVFSMQAVFLSSPSASKCSLLTNQKKLLTADTCTSALCPELTGNSLCDRISADFTVYISGLGHSLRDCPVGVADHFATLLIGDPLLTA